MKKNFTYDIIFEAVLYIAILGYIIYGAITGEQNYIINGIMTAGVMALPRVIMKAFKFKASPFLNVTVQFFIFVSMFLGKLNNYYGKFSWWDLFLHAVSGIVIFLVAYMIFLLQNNCEKDNVSPMLIITYALLFAVAMTAIWEMWEFTGDKLLGLNSQGGSLQDTMEDIVAGSTGPLIMVPVLYYYLKGKKNILFEDITNFIKKNNKKEKIKR
ncbi:hypothetical protein [uncultured Clostridium sp.]|jgi:uncharacterized membrane protein|uniref:hypothetical protein n=1 Tax=uncultured Clostridium sp. TaxID=59620 RepID=UPI0026033373|nr:hypothetical protein [uncultured Clostridium sp.]